MADCVWPVKEEDRKCGYCTIRQWCKSRVYPDTRARDIGKKYIALMHEISGTDPLESTRKKLAVWARNIIAYQLSLDGYVQEEIATVIRRDRNTVPHCIKSMEFALNCPRQYPIEIMMWNQFREKIVSLKKN